MSWLDFVGLVLSLITVAFLWEQKCQRDISVAAIKEGFGQDASGNWVRRRTGE